MAENKKNVAANLTDGKAKRHIFDIGVKLTVVAPSSVTPNVLAKEIDILVDKYLQETYKISRIAMPVRHGLPRASGDYIYELKDKMEDIR